MFRQNVQTDTPDDVLQNLLKNAEVTGLIVEVLGTALGSPADPSKREMGKKKNHWVLRFLIHQGVEYCKNGEEKTCLSVRAGVEISGSSLVCQKVTLRPMANAQQTSSSALAHFGFQRLCQGLKVKDFLAVADCLLPFKYEIVAKSLVPSTQPSSSRKGALGRAEELQEHPNGCRDFTSQWFYRLHRAGYVSWETVDPRHVGGLQPVQNSEAFHHIIGFRYSPGRIDPCPIAQARMPPGQRCLECRVALVFNPDIGTPIDARDGFNRLVDLPYQDVQPPVQVFRQTASVLNSSAGRGRSASRR